MKKAKIIYERLKLAKNIVFSPFSQKTIFLREEDRLKAEVELCLRKAGIGRRGIEDDIIIKKLVDNICKVVDPSNSANLNTLEEICNDAFKAQYWNMAIAAGVATIWELKVRILAERLGVTNKVELKDKSKKEKNMELVGYKKLDFVIRGINEKTNGKLKLRLSNLNELRGALVHTNLQQLRILYNNSFQKFKKEIKGNVISFSLYKKDEELTNLSDSMKAAEAEVQDIFAWFLEGTNSQLLELIIQEFEKNINAIEDLIGFISHSHHECAGFYKKVIFDNIKLSQHEENLFLNRETFKNTTKDSSDFLNRIYAYFGLG